MVAMRAPALREVPLDDQTDAFAFGEALFAGRCDVLVMLTGVGTRALVDTLATRWPLADVLAAFRELPLICRGPKPVAVLKELGLKSSLIAPEPNTWRELLTVMSDLNLEGKHLWLQEYGRSNESLLAALRARGAEVHRAAVYAWQLPEDTAPLERAIVALCDAQADAVLVTSGSQIDHLIEVAQRMDRAAALLDALRSRALVISIGPMTSEALAAHGLRADLEPAHPKMGHMVKTLAQDGVLALDRKRESAT